MELEFRAQVDAEAAARTDYEFLTTPEAREILRQEGIVVTDYPALQRAWRWDRPPG